MIKKLPLAALALAALLARADDFSTEFLEKTYPANREARSTFNENWAGREALEQCHFAAAKEGGHCLKLLGDKTIGDQRLLFLSGPNLNNVAASAGRDELWVFARDGGGWRELAHGGGTSFANEGRGSAAVQWLAIGPERWAAVAAGHLTQNGLSQSAQTLYWLDRGAVKAQTIITATDNGGTGCGANYLNLQGELAVRSDLPASGGFYPLEITLNGSDGQRSHENEKFTFSYDEKTGSYTVPKDYPPALQDPSAAE